MTIENRTKLAIANGDTTFYRLLIGEWADIKNAARCRPHFCDPNILREQRDVINAADAALDQLRRALVLAIHGRTATVRRYL